MPEDSVSYAKGIYARKEKHLQGYNDAWHFSGWHHDPATFRFGNNWRYDDKTSKRTKGR